jgi:cobalt-zinc-cadmium efflux system membrane fusion protein
MRSITMPELRSNLFVEVLHMLRRLCTAALLLSAMHSDARAGSNPVARDQSRSNPGSESDAELEVPRTLKAPSTTCTKTDTIIRFDKPETERDAGFEFNEVREARLSRSVVRNAEIAYDANRFARLSSRAAGVVLEMHKDLGAQAAAGEVLFVVDSVELGAAKARLLQVAEQLRLAEKNYAREQDLFQQKIGAERDLHEAETKLAESRITLAQARQALRNLGMTDGQIEDAQKSSDTSSRLEIRAPFDGTIIDRAAVVGEVVAAGQTVLSIADTRRMWAMIDIQTSDLTTVHAGQNVLVTVDGLRGETFGGRITWISTQLDPRTRTIKARAELGNEKGLLLASMFGQAKVITRAGQMSTVIPKEAVQWDGCCNMVFVKLVKEPGAFQPRKVRLGYSVDDQYEVLAGVQPGDILVTRGSYLLKTEILKDSIGAGCCDAVEELPK